MLLDCYDMAKIPKNILLSDYSSSILKLFVSEDYSGDVLEY
jgi:hypothetical protein